jgi:hypothetical protein
MSVTPSRKIPSTDSPVRNPRVQIGENLHGRDATSHDKLNGVVMVVKLQSPISPTIIGSYYCSVVIERYMRRRLIGLQPQATKRWVLVLPLSRTQ